MSHAFRRPMSTLLATAILSALFLFGISAVSVPGTVLGAATTKVAVCGANLRTSASTRARARTSIPIGTRVTVVASVSGGRWTTTCAGKRVSGRSWYRISGVNGRSVKSLYGVTYLYAKSAQFRAATVMKYPVCAASLKTSPFTTARARTSIKVGMRVTVVATVTGGRWTTTCAGATVSGKSWYRISGINGRSVKSLYGVSYLYARSGQFRATPTPTPFTPPPAPGTTRIYGSAIGMDGIGNTQIGGPNGSPGRLVGYRFRASTSAALTSIQFAQTNGPGYWGGTGGSLSITLQTDDGTAGHYPSGTILAAAGFIPQNTAGYWPVLRWPSPPTLSAGRLYHIVFRNTDPAPATNYTSVNNLYVAQAETPRQPKYSDTDWAETVSDGSWWTRPDYTPSLGLYYANGVADGVGYAYIGPAATISGSSRVRETFTVSGPNRTIASVGVRLKDVSGSDPLTVRLETAGGTEIDTATIPAAALTGKWAAVSFGAAHTLTTGSSYNLQLSTPAASRYSMRSSYQGTTYGSWDPATYFADGRAQADTGGGWANWGGRTDEDIQFYLR